PTQTHGGSHSHALEKHRPLLSRRRSPNRPSDKSCSDMATLRVDQSVHHRITRQSPTGIPNLHSESLCRTETCASPSPLAGRDRLASALARSKSGEGAYPHARTGGEAPSPGAQERADPRVVARGQALSPQAGRGGSKPHRRASLPAESGLAQRGVS